MEPQVIKSNIADKLSTELAIDDMINFHSKTRLTKISLNLSKESKQLYQTEEDVLLSDEEEKILIVDNIKQEIIKNALDLIYENYLEKQTVYFVSHCSRLAWKALVEWNFQRKDKFGYRESDENELDSEPKPSPKDSWAGHSVQIAPEGRESTLTPLKESRFRPSTTGLLSTDDVTQRVKTTNPLITITQVTKGLSLKSKGDKRSTADKQGVRIKRSEDASKLIEGKSNKPDEARKDSYELPAPIALQAKHFPSARVEVQYAIMPGNPTKGVSMKNELKTKNIYLKKSKEDVTEMLKTDV